MTNEALKAIIGEFGDKTFAIILNNNHKVFLGAKRDEKNTIMASDLEFRTFNGIDMFGIHHVDITWGRTEVPYTCWFVTAFIEAVFTTDELTANLPDLNKIY